MGDIPSYTKVLTMGSLGTERVLCGSVVVQEKVDGSQFKFGITADGQMVFASHKQQLWPESCNAMFKPAVDYCSTLSEKLHGSYADLFFYCEYLQRPRHNTLSYERVPQNGLVLFDVLAGGRWQGRDSIEAWAMYLEVDAIPELARGELALSDVQALLETPSYLGNETVEGVVVKNYHELINLGGRTFPVFCKLVRETFQERNKMNWKAQTNKSKQEAYIDSFRTEARWQKAAQHLAESGGLQNTPQDIGPLMREVSTDIDEEETENIKTELYKLYIKDIKRVATRGLPEWYKAQLVERIAEEG